MTMYRYYKGPERRERWKVIEADREQARLASEEIMFATVLTVSEKPGSGEAVSELAKYQGPFFVDVDNDDSITSAIKTAKTIVNRLLLNKVAESSISVWASGKRGFHITVPMGVFTEDTPVVRLPMIYKQMAIALKLFDLPDVDSTVYSSGKGRMWRLENKLRPDNNKYKVRLTVDEMLNLSKEQYDEFVSAKRVLSIENKTVKSELLSALYTMCKGKTEHMEKPKGIFIDANLTEALDKKLPPCVEQLRVYENIQPGKGFNDVSLQFAKGVASFAPEESNELIESFAENATGVSYNTPGKRKQHCRTAFKIASKSAGYDWSCSSILGVLKDEPCFDCPIAFIRVQEEDKAEETPTEDEHKVEVEVKIEDAEGSEQPTKTEVRPANNSPPPKTKSKGKVTKADVDSGYNLEGLLATPEGYGFMDGSGKFRRVSNFTMKITKVFVEYIPILEMDRRVAIQAEVYITGDFSGLVFLEESNWNSKSGFISAFAGLANAAFYGKDDDVQKMKSALMLGVDGSTEIRKVHACGMHRQKVLNDWVFTYVEPGWSIDQFGNENLYTLAGKISAHPRLKSVAYPTEGDPALSTYLSNLMKVNRPHRIAQVLGWTMACFLKCHIFTFRNEFPLLSLHGEPGSGKTSTASLFAALHGVDFVLESSPLNLPATTAFPVWTFISQSTTVPRLLEEFNKSKMVRNYDTYAENFKACWNEHSVSRGTISGVKLNGGSPSGAAIQEIKLSGPVVICSEQEVNMVSLVERMVQVRFSKDDKETRAFIEAFEYCSNNRDILRSFAKACYIEALELSPQDIRAWLDVAAEYVPSEISARPRYSYQVLLTGLTFLERVCDRYKLGVLAEIRALKQEFIDYLTENRGDISTSKKISEIDIIMSKFATMAAISSNDGSLPWLVKNQQYVKDGDSLYLDPLVAHSQYLRYVSTIERGVPVIDSYKEFVNLMRGEKYCMSVSAVKDGFARGRAVFRLSIFGMSKKNIPVEAFED